MLFSEVGHKYEGYTSVSEFLGKYKPVFPKDLMASKVATKDNTTPESILEKWEINADISRTYGNAVHKTIEYWIKYGEVSKVEYLSEIAKKFAKKYDRKDLISEIVAFNDKIKVAGTIDIIHKLGNKEVEVIDIKTNGELTEKGKGYFLKPLDDLQFSKINEYRLQLSTYKWLLERKGLKVKAIKLEHFTKDFETIELEPIDINKII